MSEPTYQIVFRGKLLTGFDRNQVRANLARLFKSDPSRIDALLDAPKTVLKSALTRDAATRYQEVLRQAGIMVALMADAAPVAAPLAATVPSTPQPGLSPIAAMAYPVEPPVAIAPESTATAGSGMTLADAGERIIDLTAAPAPTIDTSALSLAAVGVTLVESRVVPTPQFDFAGMSVSTDSGPIDAKPKAPPARIDTSALSLAEAPAAPAEKPMTELQKLMSTAVD